MECQDAVPRAALRGKIGNLNKFYSGGETTTGREMEGVHVGSLMAKKNDGYSGWFIYSCLQKATLAIHGLKIHIYNEYSAIRPWVQTDTVFVSIHPAPSH